MSINGSPLDAPQNSQTQSQLLEQTFQRTATVVIWYKANTEPVRLHLTVPTFPLFQLTLFPSLVASLNITPASFLDTYNPQSRLWEQNTVDSVIMLHTFCDIDKTKERPRLLYRVRKSLFEGLKEEECLGLKEEMSLQGLARKRGSISQGDHETGRANKRIKYTTSSDNGVIDEDEDMEDIGSPIPRPRSALAAPHHHHPLSSPPPHHILPGVMQYHAPYPHHPPPPMYLPPPPHQPNSFPETSAQAQAQFEQSMAHHPSQAHASRPPVSTGAGFSNRRWPNDFSITEMNNGFNLIDTLVTASGISGLDDSSDPSAHNPTPFNQKHAFERAFRVKYVKSTACRHKAVWKKASQGLKDEFLDMDKKGMRGERNSWSEFVRRVEGRGPGRTAGAGGAVNTDSIIIVNPDAAANRRRPPPSSSAMRTDEAEAANGRASPFEASAPSDAGSPVPPRREGSAQPEELHPHQTSP